MVQFVNCAREPCQGLTFALSESLKNCGQMCTSCKKKSECKGFNCCSSVALAPCWAKTGRWTEQCEVNCTCTVCCCFRMCSPDCFGHCFSLRLWDFETKLESLRLYVFESLRLNCSVIGLCSPFCLHNRPITQTPILKKLLSPFLLLIVHAKNINEHLLKF